MFQETTTKSPVREHHEVAWMIGWYILVFRAVDQLMYKTVFTMNDIQHLMKVEEEILLREMFITVVKMHVVSVERLLVVIFISASILVFSDGENGPAWCLTPKIMVGEI